jgi:hypothetical protein
MEATICEPTTLAVASLAMTAVSTGVGFIGQMNQQAAAGAQSNYLAQMAQRNQQIYDMQAKDATDRGQVQEDRQREKTAQILGTQRAALASQGTDLAGSPTDILADTRTAGELDALTIRSNAAKEAWGYKVQAANAGAEASMRSSFQPSYLGAGASLLAGASGIADKWSRFKYSAGGSAGADPYVTNGSASYDISGGLV